jgi:hypothetical protein
VNEGTAHSAIVLAAFIVAGVYGWRWLTGVKREEKVTLKSLVGYERPLTSPEGFLVAWGITFFILAAVSAFLPTLAGSLALLILFGDVMANFAGAAEGAIKLSESKTEKKTESKTEQKASKK